MLQERNYTISPNLKPIQHKNRKKLGYKNLFAIAAEAILSGYALRVSNDEV